MMVATVVLLVKKKEKRKKAIIKEANAKSEQEGQKLRGEKKITNENLNAKGGETR